MSLIIAKDCAPDKQKIAHLSGDTSAMGKKGINQIIAEAVSWHMANANPPMSNRRLAEKAGISEGTVRNILSPQDRASVSGQADPSVKVSVLALIAAALDAEVSDLVLDLSSEARARRAQAEAVIRLLETPATQAKEDPEKEPPLGEIRAGRRKRAA